MLDSEALAAQVLYCVSLLSGDPWPWVFCPWAQCTAISLGLLPTALQIGVTVSGFFCLSFLAYAFILLEHIIDYFLKWGVASLPISKMFLFYSNA